ncbi:MAG TPA: hypothetical protein VFZ34_06575 [Blastocatellia bacterium]|nr:hypothetical protein [Blastocatellia bacterium]
MSKLNAWKFALAAMLVLSSLLVAQAPRPTTAPKAEKTKPITSAEVAKLTQEILQQVSDIRGLKLLAPVKSGAQSRAQIEQVVIKNFEEETTPAELDAEFKTLVAFGLVPKHFQYREFLTKLLTEQIAGFYDPKKKEFFLADWNPLELQRPVMAHELTHALQDQHFDLKRFENWPDGDGDREMAIHALIEGDATALMIDYLMKPLGQNVTKIPKSLLEQMNSDNKGPGMEVINAAPNAIRESLLFPYASGLGFAYDLLKAQGWDGVSKAYQNLPQSTEQILHPAKYLNNEMPIKIELADVSGVLGKGWQRLTFDVNGEFGYYLLLAEFLDKTVARKAAEGWGGDQFALYENAAKTRTTVVHVSRWDSSSDASKFFEAYVARTDKRLPNAKVNKTAQQIVYTTPTGETLLALRGDAVVAVEGAAIATARKLAAQLWESKGIR